MARRLSDCAIAVMAKAPRPGHCKTRLVPPLSFDEAAAISAAFLNDTTLNIVEASRRSPITPYVAYAPAGLETLLERHVAAGTRLLLADGAIEAPPNVSGFGRPLLHAIRSLLDAGHCAACVLNADGPTLPTEFLIETASILAVPGDRAVLGPAEDGGYYLLGLKHAHAHLFADIAWSMDSVAETTRTRAAELGLTLVELPAWYDVDDAPSFARLLHELDEPAGRGFHAPATRHCIDRLDLRRAA